MNDPFNEICQMIDNPPEPIVDAPGRVRRLLITATIDVPAKDALTSEIEAFESDYEILVGVIDLIDKTGPTPTPSLNAEPLRDMLRGRLQRILELCHEEGTVQ